MKNGTILWLCGRYIKLNNWHFQGIFKTKKEAIIACKDNTYFIGPVKLGEELPKEKVEWDGCYYPMEYKFKK